MTRTSGLRAALGIVVGILVTVTMLAQPARGQEGTMPDWANQAGAFGIGGNTMVPPPGGLNIFGLPPGFGLELGFGWNVATNVDGTITHSSSNGRSNTGADNQSQTGFGLDGRFFWQNFMLGVMYMQYAGEAMSLLSDLDLVTPGDEALTEAEIKRFVQFYVGYRIVLGNAFQGYSQDPLGFHEAVSYVFHTALDLIFYPFRPLIPAAYAPQRDFDVPYIPGLAPASPTDGLTAFVPPSPRSRAGEVSLTPWIGLRFEDAEIRAQTTEAGTTYNFQNEESYTALSYGVDVQTFLTNDVFLRFTYARDNIPDFAVSGRAFNFHTATTESTTADRFMLTAGIALN